MVALFADKMTLYCTVFSISALPFAIHILIQKSELAFQRDWDDQVSVVRFNYRLCTANRFVIFVMLT
jgi:hypothetical protein